jgi:CRP-like cAMP-binding protein
MIDTTPGRVLVWEGTRASEFYVIIDGRATVSVAGRMFQTLQPGQSFGEIGLLDRSLRVATVTAATPMTLLVFTTVEFHDVLEAAPPVAVALLRNHLGRLRAAQSLAVELDVASPAARHQADPRMNRECSTATEAPSTLTEPSPSPIGLMMCV